MENNEKIKALVILCLIEFCISICFAIISPFFPHEAENKNVPQLWIGIIFGVFQGIQFLISPIFGIYMFKFGVKKLYLYGIGIDIVSTLLFGITNWIPTQYPISYYFILSTLFLRILQGIGCSAYITSSYLITVHLYPNNIGTAIGIVETSAGLGFALGPPIGGYLYMLGGYSLPFITISISLFCLFFLAIKFIPRVDHHSKTEEQASPTIKKSLTKWYGQKLEKNYLTEGTLDNGLYINGHLGLLNDMDDNNKPNLDLVNKINEAFNENLQPQLSYSDVTVDFTLESAPTLWGHLTSLVKLFQVGDSIWLDYLIMFCGATTVSFIDSTLEPHLRSVSAFWELDESLDLNSKLNVTRRANVLTSILMLHDQRYVISHNHHDYKFGNSSGGSPYGSKFLQFSYPLNSATIGSIFFVLSTFYTIFAPIFGALTDCKRLCGHYINTRSLIRFMLIISLFLSAMALAISGIPVIESPFNLTTTTSSQSVEFTRHSYSYIYVLIYKIKCLFQSKNSAKLCGVIPMSLDKESALAAIIASQILFGLTFAAQIVLTFTDIMKRVSNNRKMEFKTSSECTLSLHNSDLLTLLKDHVPDSNESITCVSTSPGPSSNIQDIHSLVSGFYSSALALGAFCGPVFAGSILGHGANHYSKAADILSMTNLVCFMVVLCLTAYKLGKNESL